MLYRSTRRGCVAAFAYRGPGDGNDVAAISSTWCCNGHDNIPREGSVKPLRGPSPVSFLRSLFVLSAPHGFHVSRWWQSYTSCEKVPCVCWTTSLCSPYCAVTEYCFLFWWLFVCCSITITLSLSFILSPSRLPALLSPSICLSDPSPSEDF